MSTHGHSVPRVKMQIEASNPDSPYFVTSWCAHSHFIKLVLVLCTSMGPPVRFQVNLEVHRGVMRPSSCLFSFSAGVLIVKCAGLGKQNERQGTACNPTNRSCFVLAAHSFGEILQQSGNCHSFRS